MTCSTEYAPRIRSLGFRVTNQRLAILHVLRRAPGHLSPVDVYTQARRKVPGLTHTTVYRNLEFLSKAGLVWRIDRPAGHAAYELAEKHHHHLICRGCGKEVPLGDAVVTAAYRRLETTSGFRIDHDHVSLTGLCPACRRNGAAR